MARKQLVDSTPAPAIPAEALIGLRVSFARDRIDNRAKQRKS